MVVGRSHSIREIAENYPDVSYYCGEKIRGGEKYNLKGHSVLTESADALSVFDKKVSFYLWGVLGAGFLAQLKIFFDRKFVKATPSIWITLLISSAWTVKSYLKKIFSEFYENRNNPFFWYF